MLRVAGWHPYLPAPPPRLRLLVPADDAVLAGGAVASLTPDQVSHFTPGLRIVLYPWRRNTHDCPSYLTVKSGEVGAQVEGEQFVHGLPLSGEREPPKYS